MKVVIIAYFFPPLSQVGYRRPLRFAEYLRSQGHEVTVFGAHPKTPALENYSGIDSALNEKIPPGVRVVRTPSTHGFKVLLAFRDRLRKRSIPDPSSSAASAQIPSQQEARPSEPNRSKGLLSRWVDRVMDWFLVPDHYTGWILTTLPLILLERFRGRIDVIFATAPPWSGLITAALAGRILGIPVCLDYRDPWTFNPYWTAKHRRVSQVLERWTLRTGKATIVNTVAMEREFLRQYPQLRGRLFTVYNGYEEETRLEMEQLSRKRGTPNRSEFVVSHVGVLYRDRMPQQLARTLAAVSASWEGRRRIVFKFVGPVMDPTVLQREFAEVGQSHALRFTGEVAVHTAREEEANADVLLLLYPGSLLQVPAKVFEYAFAGNPILAVADEGSETAELVLRHRLGALFSGMEPPETIRAFLQEKERSPREIVPPSSSFIEEFDGSRLSERILAIVASSGQPSK